MKKGLKFRVLMDNFKIIHCLYEKLEKIIRFFRDNLK
jgi:hypothetical protein